MASEYPGMFGLEGLLDTNSFTNLLIAQVIFSNFGSSVWERESHTNLEVGRNFEIQVQVSRLSLCGLWLGQKNRSVVSHVTSLPLSLGGHPQPWAMTDNHSPGESFTFASGQWSGWLHFPPQRSDNASGWCIESRAKSHKEGNRGSVKK